MIDELRARRCEGLIVASATRDARPRVPPTGVPTVLVTRDIDGSGLPLVAADDAAGVRAAVAHLRELGHERIAHVTGPLVALDDRPAPRRVPRRRGRRRPGRARRRVHDRRRRARRARAAARRTRTCTAIVAGNDMIALGCYAALAAAGLRCPADVSVTGHNDMPLVDRVQPPLTTVAIPQHEIGVAAARLLLAGSRGEDEPARRTLLETRLVVRGSTAPPRKPAGPAR